MFRIINSLGKPIKCMADVDQGFVAMQGKKTDRFRVKVFQTNGHTEVTASREIMWEEIDISRNELEIYFQRLADETDEEKAKREARLLDDACRRAKTRVRQLCKAMHADTLLTLTYRACESDLARVKADLKEFNRRIKRVLPSFQFVAAFEKQKRGAWHMHLATHAIPADLPASNGVKVKSFNIIRAIWRGVVGAREGNIDVSRRKRSSQRSPARIASYISSYVAKDFADGDKWVNRYAAYGTPEIPKRADLGVVEGCRECLDLVFGLLTDRDRVVNMYLSRFQDVFYLAAEAPA